MIKILCQFFSCLVDIWEVCKRNSELNAQVLEHFLQPPQQLLFLSWAIWRWQVLISLLTILPKGRHLFLQIGDKDCMDLTTEKGYFFVDCIVEKKLDTYFFLVTFTNLCRSSPLDKIIHLSHCWEPWQPLEVTKKIALENKKKAVLILEWYHFETCSASNSSRLATYLRGWLQKLPTYTLLTWSIQSLSIISTS